MKGGSGGPKLKKKFEKNGGSMGGSRGGVMVEQIFSKKLVFEKKPQKG